MSKHVISVDLWGTVFEFSTEMSVSIRRKELVREYILKLGVTDKELIDSAYDRAASYFYEKYESDAVTLTPRDRLLHQFRLLGVDADGSEFENLVGVVENAILENPPQLAPHLRKGLDALSKRFTLVMVSDTAFSTGKVIREVLRHYGIAPYFADYSFSDENGRSKPDPYAFMSVLERVGGTPSDFLHIGDTEWSDISGAQKLGGRACLYVGLNDRWLDETHADFILHDWADVSGLIDHIERSTSGVK